MQPAHVPGRVGDSGSRILPLLALGFALRLSTSITAAADAERPPVEWADRCVGTIEELASVFRDEQSLFLQLMPPDPEQVLTQPCGLLAFTWRSFPASFNQGLIGEMDHGCPRYILFVAEDPVTRETVFANADGKEIFALRPEPGFDPYWLFHTTHPELALGRGVGGDADGLLAGYDSSRIQVVFQLVPSEFNDACAAARGGSVPSSSAPGLGGMMAMGYGGPPVTDLVLSQIELQTNRVVLTVVYPDDYTNRLDILTCDGGTGLLDFWWDLAVTTNVETSTNWVGWMDPESSNASSRVRYYAAANADLDSDADGFSDGREAYVYHTDPGDPNSRPHRVSGVISYTGTLTGPVRMLAVAASNSWMGCVATLAGTGAYTNDKVGNGTGYWFKAYRDGNANRIREYGEPWGVYSSVAMAVTNDLAGINIMLTEDTDEDDDGLPDGWELEYFGGIWTQDADDDNDGDALSNAHELSHGANPACADTDGDGLEDGVEVFTHSTDPLHADSDLDNMGDGAEVVNGQPPTGSNVYVRLPFEEGFETNSVGTGVLHGARGWIVSSTNQVILETQGVHAGQQVAEIGVARDPVTVSHLLGARDQTNVWIDFWAAVDPATITCSEPVPDLSLVTNGCSTVLAVNRYGGIALYDATPGEETWRVVSNCLSELTVDFHRFTVNQDFAGGKWAFYFDGVLAASNLCLRGNFHECHKFSCQGTQAGAMYLDTLSVGAARPDGLRE